MLQVSDSFFPDLFSGGGSPVGTDTEFPDDSSLRDIYTKQIEECQEQSVGPTFVVSHRIK